MKLGTRRTNKILSLLAGGSCLLFLVLCFSRWLQHQYRESVFIDRTNEAGTNTSEQTSSNKSIFLKHYAPKVRFDEKSLEAFRLRRNRERVRARLSSLKTDYLIQPRNNVIECKKSLRAPYEFDGPHQDDGKATTLFIVINSRTDNFERRRRLRSSWLSKENLSSELCPTNQPGERIAQKTLSSVRQAKIARVEWVFALGHFGANSSGAIDSELRDEARLNGDILMLDLHESYRNLTRKHLAIFEWLLERRREGAGVLSDGRQILVKCDDDVQLDLRQLISMYAIEAAAQTNHPTRDLNLLMCARFEENTPVLRKSDLGPKTKWSLSRREWPYDTFPSYCSGLAYLASLELVENLYLVAAVVDRGLKPPLWIDDVYITGILWSALDLDDAKLVRLNPFFCYTKAQRLHRESLEPGVRCMAAEMSE